MANGVNAAKTSTVNKKKNNNKNHNCLDEAVCDIGKISYYNCNKKRHYLSNWPEFLTISFGFGNLAIVRKPNKEDNIAIIRTTLKEYKQDMNIGKLKQ